MFGLMILVNTWLYAYGNSDAPLWRAVDTFFNSKDNYHIRTDIISQNELNMMCWIQTTNTIEYQNGTKAEERDYSVIFDNGINADEAKSHIISDPQYNFTTVFTANNFTININKSIICGVGEVMTKIYTQWGTKKRLQINIGSKQHDKDKTNNLNYSKIFAKDTHSNVLKKKFSVFNQTYDSSVTGPQQLLIRRTKHESNNKATAAFKAIIIVKLYESLYNETEGTNVDTIREVIEQKQKIVIDNHNFEGNITDKSIKQAWKKYSKLIALKLYNDFQNDRKNENIL